ncbi:hypothetical protein WUBG_18147 [Wuchereria bancrofti]|uniref:Uncharacterized protein n=1 Tax=Wuchereria bancrofti TaxID=6293 RepID=J9AAE9_WUCBA|nr:hypothetical protein WUBG_18147 [Wuchereria bancrofti]
MERLRKSNACLKKEKNKYCLQEDYRRALRRNGRQSYQRGNEQNKSINDGEKPVMNLFDPCKVPTGRSYFTLCSNIPPGDCLLHSCLILKHDDRAAKSVRISRSRYSTSTDGGWQSLPVGWRNVRKVFL